MSLQSVNKLDVIDDNQAATLHQPTKKAELEITGSRQFTSWLFE